MQRFSTRTLLLCGIFFIVYAALAGAVGTRFSSPDETSNYVFAKTFASTGSFRIPNNDVTGVVHPRSTAQRDGAVVPLTFLGYPLLLGTAARLVGVWVIPFIGPLFAALGLGAFAALMRRVTNERTALLGAILLGVNPVFAFYAYRGLWHNGPFVALLLLGTLALVRAVESGRTRPYAFAGAGFAAALAMRGSEFPWVLGGLAIGLLLVRRRWTVRGIVLAAVTATAVLLPVLLLQRATFGSAIAGTYDAALAGTDALGFLGRSVHAVQLAVAPFGWHPVQAANVFFLYGLQFLFPWVALGLVGAIGILAGRPGSDGERPQVFWHATGFIALTLWLVLYYGSFGFVEFRLNPSAVLLGSSYLRYWLPIVVVAIPFSILGLRRILGERRNLVGSTLVVIALLGMVRLIWDPHDGYVAELRNLHASTDRRAAVLTILPADAILLAGPEDKVYWPDRKVVGFDYGPMPDAVLRALPTLRIEGPVYFPSFLPGEVDRVNQRLNVSGFYFRFIRDLPGDFELYQLVPVQGPVASRSRGPLVA